MKTVFLAAVASLVLAFAAHAETMQQPVSLAATPCAPRAGAAMRVAYALPQGPECCAQQLRCTQLLSTTTIEQPRLEHRT